MRQTNINQQQGVTLIELMISLVISMILMLGVVGLYVTSKRGYVLQDDLARQQENARFSLDTLMHDIRMAGYSPTGNFVGDPINLATTADGGGTASDTITLAFDSPTDCLNQAAPGNVAVNRYFIDADNNLSCLGNGGADSEVLAEGVVNMQILYGIDTDGAADPDKADGQANKYVNWSSVIAIERDFIVSIRLGLLTSTPNESASAQNNKDHLVLDQTITTTEKRIYRVYTNTIVMRNRV